MPDISKYSIGFAFLAVLFSDELGDKFTFEGFDSWLLVFLLLLFLFLAKKKISYFLRNINNYGSTFGRLLFVAFGIFILRAIFDCGVPTDINFVCETFSIGYLSNALIVYLGAFILSFLILIKGYDSE